MGILRMRPYDMAKDLDGTTELAEVAYVEDYRRLGTSAKAGAERERRVVRVLSLLGRFIRPIRDLGCGFVWEDEGRIISYVHFVRSGMAGDRWSIETVVTHPKYQRRGLARRLVERSLDAIRARGGRLCTLKVREDNPSAYALYRSLGFDHYDTTVHLRCDLAPSGGVRSVEGYRIRRVTLHEWYKCWQEMHALASRCTSNEARSYVASTAESFRRPRVLRMIAPLVLRMSGRVGHIWMVAHQGALVGTLRILGDRSGERPHEIELTIDPAHAGALAEPLIDRSLDTIGQLPKATILSEVPGASADILGAFRARGFAEVSTWHALGCHLTA